MRNVFKREAKAREIEAESLEAYAKRKGITIAHPPGRRGAPPKPLPEPEKPMVRKWILLNPQPKRVRNSDGTFCCKQPSIYVYEDQDA